MRLAQVRLGFQWGTYVQKSTGLRVPPIDTEAQPKAMFAVVGYFFLVSDCLGLFQ